jgi:hypothetical protein
VPALLTLSRSRGFGGHFGEQRRRHLPAAHELRGVADLHVLNAKVERDVARNHEPLRPEHVLRSCRDVAGRPAEHRRRLKTKREPASLVQIPLPNRHRTRIDLPKLAQLARRLLERIRLAVMPPARRTDRQRVQQILIADLVLFANDLSRAHPGNEVELGANFAEVIVTHDLFPFRHCYLLLNDAPRAELEAHNTIASSRPPYSPERESVREHAPMSIRAPSRPRRMPLLSWPRSALRKKARLAEEARLNREQAELEKTLKELTGG